MKSKFLNTLLIITSLLGYLEWSKDSHMFLFEIELEIIAGMFKDFASMVHPFILIPMAGQLLLITTLFQKNPHKLMTFAGMICLLVLLGFIAVIGILCVNFSIIISTVPFILVVMLTIRHYRRLKKMVPK